MTIPITEEQARMIGRAIREEAEIVSLPVENDKELRAISLKLALDTKQVALSLRADDSWEESADRVLDVAKRYEAYIAGRAET